MKKGFTLVELLAVIVVLAILSGLAVVSMNGVFNTGKKGVYKNFESTIKSGVQNYLIENPDEVPNQSQSKEIKITLLGDFIDTLKDPNGGDCMTKSYVLVTRKKNNEDNKDNYNLDYKICLICVDKANNSLSLYKTHDDC